MKQYLDLLKNIKDNGYDHPDRTGVGRRSIFGTNLRFKMSDGFPLVTTRKIFTRGMIEETLWFIRGEQFTKELQDKNVNIWNPWAVKEEHVKQFFDKFIPNSNKDPENKTLIETFVKHKESSVGPMYGYNWRHLSRDDDDLSHMAAEQLTEDEIPKDKLHIYKSEYEKYKESEAFKTDPMEFLKFATYLYYTHEIDQLNDLILGLKKKPFSSRHIVTAWIPSSNPLENISPQMNVMLGKGALTACHCMFQCFVRGPLEEGGKKRLSLLVFIRSNDFPIGAPYNISQYALLLHMLAHVCDFEADELVYNVGDCHIYQNQLPFIDEQLAREPLALPKLWLNPEVKSIYDFTVDDIKIEGYQYQPEIKYPVAV